MLVVLIGVAACNGVHPDYCDGNVLHFCSEDDHGSFCSTTDCGAAAQTCVEAGDGAAALCVSDPTPNPACASAGGAPRACDGANLLECTYEYATRAVDCGAPELCDARSRYCLKRPGEDATCATLTTDGLLGASYCAGQYSRSCTDMFVTGEWDCGSTELCHAGPNGFTACIQSTTPDARCPTPAAGGTGFSSFCDGWFAVSCFDGYVHRYEDCMNPDEYGSGCPLCGH